MNAIVWRLYARVRGTEAAAAVLALLDETAGAVSIFESGPGEWAIAAYPPAPRLAPDLAARLALAAAAAGGALIAVEEAPLPARDWLADNRRAFPPLAIDRFFIHGSHYRDRVPAGMIGIRVDATTAFGTGEHASTRGCLLALAAAALSPPARHRDGHRDSRDRRRQAVAPAGVGQRHRSRRRRRRSRQRREERRRRPRARARRAGISRSRAAPAAVRPRAVEHPGPPVGAARTGAGPGSGAGRAGGALRSAGATGGIGACRPSPLRARPRTPLPDRGLVDPGPAPALPDGIGKDVRASYLARPMRSGR